jgi:hypothetical protein
MATVIPMGDLAFSPTAKLFQGRENINVSIFVVEYERGQSVPLHVRRPAARGQRPPERQGRADVALGAHPG